MTVKGIEFSKITLRDALDLAILIEEEAEERYEEFADQMEAHRTPEAANFFRYMAKNEAKHGAELTERRRRIFKDEAMTVTRAMIFDIEAPDYDEARAFMSPRAALEASLRAESKARAFFVSALPHIKDSDVRALFEELREEEVHHEDMVKRELAKLPPDSGLDPEDFVDEPAAQ